MFCRNCGKAVDVNADVCTHCGCLIQKENSKKIQNNGSNVGCLISIIIAIVIILGVIGLNVSNDMVNQKTGQNSSALYKAVSKGNYSMQSLQYKVAQDAVEEYNIAKRQGDKIQICVQAGLVSAAYLQAKDEVNYNKWKSIEKNDCKNAGIR